MTRFDSCCLDFLSCIYAFLVGDYDLEIGSMVDYSSNSSKLEVKPHSLLRELSWKIFSFQWNSDNWQYTYQGPYSKLPNFEAYIFEIVIALPNYKFYITRQTGKLKVNKKDTASLIQSTTN